MEIVIDWCGCITRLKRGWLGGLPKMSKDNLVLQLKRNKMSGRIIWEMIYLLTRIVITTKVTFIVLLSKNAERSVTFNLVSGNHSPTLTTACCFNLIKSNLNFTRRPSLNSIGPVNPFHSTCITVQYEQWVVEKESWTKVSNSSVVRSKIWWWDYKKSLKGKKKKM